MTYTKSRSKDKPNFLQITTVEQIQKHTDQVRQGLDSCYLPHISVSIFIQAFTEFISSILQNHSHNKCSVSPSNDCRHLLRREYFQSGLQITGDNINREVLLDLFQCYVLGESAAHLYGNFTPGSDYHAV